MSRRTVISVEAVKGAVFTCPACNRSLYVERDEEGKIERPETLCPCKGGEYPAKRKQEWEGRLDAVLEVLNPGEDFKDMELRLVVESE